MKRIPFLLILLLLPSASKADSFEGTWEIIKVFENKEFPWHLEVKYPAKFKLIKNEKKWEGSYKDQYDFESSFSLVADINNGREMILCHSGETKSPGAWAPIHKIKLIEGKIVGVTITDKHLFSWEAVKIKNR